MTKHATAGLVNVHDAFALVLKNRACGVLSHPRLVVRPPGLGFRYSYLYFYGIDESQKGNAFFPIPFPGI